MFKTFFGEHGIENLVRFHDQVKSSGMPNVFGCKIPVHLKLNINFIRSMLSMYHDSDVVNFLKYGLPLSCEGSCSGLSVEKNHAGTRSLPDYMRKYLKKGALTVVLLGRFFRNPFETNMAISPLNSVPKKDTLDHRVILDLSFGVDGEDSVNSHISKDLSLGNPKVSYPSVDSLVELIRRKGSGSLCYKRDLNRAYRQFPICPGDWHLFG